jgi:MFS family permease
MTDVKTFWNRHFILALISYFFLFMSITLFFIFPLFFEQFGASKTRIGLIMGVHGLMAVIIRPFFGRLIDLRGRKKISLFGIGFLIAVLPWFHLIGDAGVLPLVLRALTGIGWGISMTATMTICSDLAPVSRLAQSMGIIGVAGLLSAALGPLLGEEIVRRFDFGGLFNVSLFFLVVSFMCMVWTKEVIKPNQNPLSPRKQSLRHIAFLSLLLIFALPVFHGAIRGAVVYFIALFGKSIPLERVGPFFVAFSGAAILTRFLLGDLSDLHGRKRIIFPSVCIISFNLFLISRVQSLWLFVLVGFIGGFGQGLIFPALSTYVIDILGKENKGFAISLYLTFFDVGMALGPVAFGRISDLYGYRLMYIVAGSVFFLMGLLFTWKAPSPIESTYGR